MTQSETDLLRRALNFCPTPPPQKPDSVDKDIEAFPRGLSLRKYYSPGDISELGQQSMYQPSALEKLNERDLRECHNKPSREPYLNSYDKERNATRSLIYRGQSKQMGESNFKETK